jgi:DNA-binding NtrC family response regulator
MPDVFTEMDSCLQSLVNQPCSVCLVSHADSDDRARVVSKWIEEHGLTTQVLCLVANDSNWGLRVVPSFCCEILDEDCSVRCMKAVLNAMNHKRPRDTGPPQADLVSGRSVVLTGQSPAIRAVRRSVGIAVESKCHVVISGPEGVGKNLLARQIHVDSERAEAALVYVDCRRNPLAQLSELFDGLASDADVASQDGVIDPHGPPAVCGTLILDRVDQTPRTLQRKLARLLTSRSSRSGSGRGSCGPYGSLRMISLSTQPLVECVAHNVFDRNLYTTLAGQVVDLPPLSKRLEDIGVLVQEFFSTAIAREGHGACQLSDQALEMLHGHNWPGNLRELWHVLSHAACLTEEPRVAGGGIASWIAERSDLSSERTITLRQMERMLIESTFARCGGNREDTARSLGIGLRTLSGKLRDYGYPPRGGPGSNQLLPSLKAA